jgi:hypothetical protein
MNYAKTLTLAVLLVAFGFQAITAQFLSKAKIEDVKTKMISDDKIEVSFMITNTAKNELLDVTLKFQSGNKDIYPKTISGSTQKLSSGTHSIIWDVLKDVNELEDEIKVVIQIVGTTHVLKVQNAFTPGFNSGNKILATISYACLVTGTIQYLNANKNYNSYKNELENYALRADYYDKAVGAKSQSIVLLGAGVGLLATNLVLARVHNKKYNLASLSYKNGGICLSYVHTFHN